MSKEKRLVPELRFPEFDGEWRDSLIGEQTKVLMCKRVFKDQTVQDGEIPFYKIGTIGKDPDAYIARKLYDDLRTKYSFPNKGEIMLTCSGTVGKCFIYDGSDAYYQDSNIVWLKNEEDQISNSFLYYFLSEFDWGKLNQTTIARIYNDDLRKIRVRYPRIMEQQKIATFLSLIDKKIELLEKKVELLEEQKKGLLQKIFTQEIRFKKDDGSEFEEWMKIELCKVFREYNKKTISNNQYPIITSSNRGIYLQDNYFKKQTASSNNIGYKIVPFGYFTYRSMSDTGSFTFNIQELVDLGIVSPAYPVFTTITGYNKKFLYYTLNHSKEMTKEMALFSEGGTRIALSYAKFTRIKLSLPSLREQNKIANFLSKVDLLVDNNKQKLEYTKKQKKGLLQKIFI